MSEDRKKGFGFGSNPQERADSRAVSEAGKSLRASRQTGLRMRAGQTEEAGEPLVCPSCGAQFEFGDMCPDCSVALVGLSALESAEPELPLHVQAKHTERKLKLGILISTVIIFGAMLAYVRWVASAG